MDTASFLIVRIKKNTKHWEYQIGPCCIIFIKLQFGPHPTHIHYSTTLLLDLTYDTTFTLWLLHVTLQPISLTVPFFTNGLHLFIYFENIKHVFQELTLDILSQYSLCSGHKLTHLL